MKKHPNCKVLILAAALTAATVLPASAFLFSAPSASSVSSVSAFAKNGTVDRVIPFSAADFAVEGSQKLDSILITALPDLHSGVLTVGGHELAPGSTVARTALNGLQFHPLSTPTVAVTSFSFTPRFSDGSSGEEVTVDLYLLTAENASPVAEDLEISTYKNVAVTERFAAVDPEGDLLTFRLMEKPTRGSVTLNAREGSCEFVYTPYDNKTGKDSFTYVAVDSVGNTSAPATVKVRIEKAKTKVTYTDMKGEASYKSAIRLAEEGLFVGECMNGEYFFRPDQTVSRSEFVALAMKVAGQTALTTVSRTGFSDDEAIPTWAKGYVASGLKAGLVKGTVGKEGKIVFQGSSPVTRAEASVLLDRILNVTEVTVPTFYADTESAPAWAYQSAVNLETAGVLRTDTNGALSLTDALTRADAAELLCGALDLLRARENSGFFN